jgi:4-hydroxybenzoate polyprenyltransferase
LARVGGLIRLTHPFPCLLDGIVVGIVAAITGSDGATAVRLGVAMTLLQVSIGSLNDLVDAPRDAGRTPAKPIPAGLVSRPVAWLVVTASAVVGVVLSVPSGPPTAALAVVVLAIGYAYDVRFKGTAWSWVPFAVGIPLLPAFGWLGTAGDLPASFAILLPAAVLAGAGLAVSNALADVERDAAAGTDSVATRLGPGRAWVVQAILLVAVVAAAWLTLAIGSGGQGGVSGTAAIAGALGATGVIGIGIALGRGGDAARRERAWELEAIGVGLLAAAWLAGVPLG